MKLFRIHSEVLIREPLDTVFAFFADARNLQRITPPWLNFEVTSPTPIEMKTGQTIDYRLRLHGLPVRWRSEIAEWAPPHRFVDEQVRGPYKMWYHEHTFAERGANTVCEDKVVYSVWGGTLVNRLLVERDVKRIFEYRRKRLLEIFSGDADEARP